MDRQRGWLIPTPLRGGEGLQATPGPIAAWAYPLALITWASTWHLRNSVLFSWSPIEPIWLGTGAVVLCVLHRLGQGGPPRPQAIVPLLVLIVTFAPGAVRVAQDTYGPTKLADLALVTLPMFVAAILLLDSRAAQMRWLWTQVLMAGAVAAAALRFSDPTALLTTGRLALDTVDTISTARLVAVGAVVLVLLALTSLRRYWWTLPAGLGLGVVVLQVGSRGPVLFLVLAISVAVLAAKVYAGRRLVPVVVMGVMLIAAFDFLASGGAGGGGDRILGSAQEGFEDIARTELLHSAVQLGYAHPGGVGWGQFADYSQIGGELANEQGNYYAHNVLAEAFSEGGLVALFGLVFVIGYALWRLYRSSADPILAVVLGVTLFWLFNALVSYDLVGNRFLWLSLACGLAVVTDRPAGDRAMEATSSAPAPG